MHPSASSPPPSPANAPLIPLFSPDCKFVYTSDVPSRCNLIASNAYLTAPRSCIRTGHYKCASTHSLSQIIEPPCRSATRHPPPPRQVFLQDLGTTLSSTRWPSRAMPSDQKTLTRTAKGLRDWNSTALIDVSMRLEDHHIYPRAYVANSSVRLDIDQSEAEQLVDCVVNRTLIPKILNIQVGKRAPSDYLSDIKARNNPKLEQSLESHLLPAGMVTDTKWNECFSLFLNERAERIFDKIKEVTSDRMTTIEARHGVVSESREANQTTVLRLKDLIGMGLVLAGDRVFVKKRPDQFASIVDGDNVDYDGKRMLINTWGQQMTGWPSISIYASVYLERTGQTIGSLRTASTVTD